MEELGLVREEAGVEVLEEVGLPGEEAAAWVLAEAGLAVGTGCRMEDMACRSPMVVTHTMDMGCHGLAVATHGKR